MALSLSSKPTQAATNSTINTRDKSPSRAQRLRENSQSHRVLCLDPASKRDLSCNRSITPTRINPHSEVHRGVGMKFIVNNEFMKTDKSEAFDQIRRSVAADS